jgi:hypothetical protein
MRIGSRIKRPVGRSAMKLAGTLALITTFSALAQQSGSNATHVYWGDVHLHSNYSWDAYGTGNLTLTPDQAYRFARGLPVIHPNIDATVRIRRPLDFLAVTDHAIMLGVQAMLDQRDPEILATEWGQRFLEIHEQAPIAGVMREGGRLGVMAGPDGGAPERSAMMEQVFSTSVRRRVWDDEIDAAEDNYVPGVFTTLIGWEWTSTPGGRNIHRSVISDATAEQARQFIPFSNYESLRPEDLWSYFEDTQRRTGVDFVAIPHNSNLSGGLMFATADSEGRPMSADYARTRVRWEPAVEIAQSKGTSEILPQLAPTDEFAGFEIWQRLLVNNPQPASPNDYVRTALTLGLGVQQNIGINPFKFGVIGATDSHTGLSSVREDRFLGHFGTDATPEARLAETQPGAQTFIFPDWLLSAAGRAAVWAPENTREAIFAAFKRREIYGTTGTRILLRFYGGFDFRRADAAATDLAAVGYRKGVPMGGDLTSAPARRSPSFLINAVKDPMGANLDRVQVIKGWVDAAGTAQQRIYDVAWSDDREPDSQGRLAPVGNTVDEATGTYTNTIGETQFATVWEDPDFDPDQLAVYYVRVLEIPTPRHSLFDAIALGVTAGQTRQPGSIQERAWSSPIWYTP